MHYNSVGNPNAPMIVFGHGWNRTGDDFVHIAEVLGQQCHCIMLDFPGFGRTPRPKDTWNTAQYADAVMDVLAGFNKPYIWVGHSFGGRVGLRLAAKSAANLQSMVLIGTAGLQRQRQGLEKWRFWQRKYGYQLLKFFANEKRRETLRKRFSSADYLLRPDIRDIFIATINEDQSDSVSKITIPTTLLIGECDQEAPPEISKRLSQLIPGSAYIELPSVGHIDVMLRSRQVIAKVILEQIAQWRVEGRA